MLLLFLLNPFRDAPPPPPPPPRSRSIEHGNMLDEECAEEMKARGAFLVSTTVTYHALREEGEAAGMAPELVKKVGDLVETGLQSIRIAEAHGVQICYGSDLLGDLHCHQLKVLAPKRFIFFFGNNWIQECLQLPCWLRGKGAQVYCRDRMLTFLLFWVLCCPPRFPSGAKN